MSKPKYDPNGLYYALKRVRRTANCVKGIPAKVQGTMYMEPAELDENGNPIGDYDTFTMADRTSEQVEMLVDQMRVIAPLPSSPKS
mgnify:CR=1 FL=1